MASNDLWKKTLVVTHSLNDPTAYGLTPQRDMHRNYIPPLRPSFPVKWFTPGMFPIHSAQPLRNSIDHDHFAAYVPAV